MLTLVTRFFEVGPGHPAGWRVYNERALQTDGTIGGSMALRSAAVPFACAVVLLLGSTAATASATRSPALVTSASASMALTDEGFAPPDAPVWHVSWGPATDETGSPLSRARLADSGLRGEFDVNLEAAAQARPRPMAVEYSRAYEIRRTIHKWASVATIPLFAAEFAVGQSLYNNTSSSDSKRGLHSALAGGIAGLFAVNSVTGVWNLWEGRKDLNGRTRRLVHGILMLAADAGFVATGATAPDGEHGRSGVLDTSGRSRHRAIALTSMGTALASYLMMLFWRD
jgi:hypothetical protein